MADKRAERIAELIRPLRVKLGSKVDLARDFDPGYKADLVKKKDGRQLLETGIALLADYQRRLAAQDTYGVLVCLQALDAGGKDGTIRHVMSGVNPQGVQVSGFKVPSAEELDHDDRDVRPGPPTWPGLGRAVRQRGLPGHRGHPGGPAHGDADDPVARRGRPGQAQRDREGPSLGGDARVHLGDQLRQDRHADDEPDDRGGGGGRPGRPLHHLRHRLRPGGQGPSRRGLGGHDRGRDPAVPGRQRRHAR